MAYYTQVNLRKELIQTEKALNLLYHSWQGCLNASWLKHKANYYYSHYVFFQGRRRFFLRELLRVQLEEFDHG